MTDHLQAKSDQTLADNLRVPACGCTTRNGGGARGNNLIIYSYPNNPFNLSAGRRLRFDHIAYRYRAKTFLG